MKEFNDLNAKEFIKIYGLTYIVSNVDGYYLCVIADKQRIEISKGIATNQQDAINSAVTKIKEHTSLTVIRN